METNHDRLCQRIYLRKVFEEQSQKCAKSGSDGRSALAQEYPRPKPSYHDQELTVQIKLPFPSFLPYSQNHATIMGISCLLTPIPV